MKTVMPYWRAPGSFPRVSFPKELDPSEIFECLLPKGRKRVVSAKASREASSRVDF